MVRLNNKYLVSMALWTLATLILHDARDLEYRVAPFGRKAVHCALSRQFLANASARLHRSKVIYTSFIRPIVNSLHALNFKPMKIIKL